MLKAKILDSFSESQTAVCYLTSINLTEYITALPTDYDKYEIQRDIVSNVYLDNLVNTIFERKHIPPIVLVVDEQSIEHKSSGELIIEDFKILDGLQRTFRLRIIFETIKFITSLDIDFETLAGFSKLEVSRRFKLDLTAIKSGTSLFYTILKLIQKTSGESIESIPKLFDRIQWFEIWKGLTPKDEINKMLILNAGHKAVSTKHQLELLFSNLLPTLEKLTGKAFKIIRDKEKTSIEYSKSRQEGEFHFSHIITALLSFADAKPLTANIDLIQKSQNEHFDDESLQIYFDAEFLNDFMSSLIDLDHSIIATYGDLGLRWLGREVSLVGIYAALGLLMREEDLLVRDAFVALKKSIIEKPHVLNIEEFEELRNSMILSKVNIGSVNKKAVFNGIHSLLKEGGEEINWKPYFKSE